MKIPSIVITIQKQPIQEINYAFHKTISYSQFSIYHKCPHKWELQYVSGLQKYQSTIHTVFGTAMHSAIQHYLTLAYNESAAAADRFDLETFFEDEFRKTYLEEYKANKDTHFTNAVEMREFFDEVSNLVRDAPIYWGDSLVDYLKIDREDLPENCVIEELF